MDDYEELAASIRSSIGWLTVDEYQDVSPLQHRLMTLWLGNNRNVCVVGDPAQTIYCSPGRAAMTCCISRTSSARWPPTSL